MQVMRRIIFGNEIMDGKHAYLRVRDEGHRVAMTYKQFDELSLTGAKEIEFTVSDYDAAIALVKAIGIEGKSAQEARREIWELDDAEVVIDEWPWIDPYIEIEALTEEAVKDAAKKLKLDWSEAAFGDIMVAYRSQYPGTAPEDVVYSLPNIRFGDPLPDLLKV